MTIRPATPADVPRLVELGTEFLAATAYGGLLPTVPASIAALMAGLIASPDGAVLVTEDRGGAVTGMLGVLCYTHPMSGAWVAGQLFWWRGPRLERAAVAWARAHGAVTFAMHQPLVATGRTGEVLDLGRHYAKRGYVPVEVAYHLDLRGGA
jgi:hypothetical protein